jgi:phage terminase small subunit
MTHRQLAFINFYVESKNATDAARRAGYTGASNPLR